MVSRAKHGDVAMVTVAAVTIRMCPAAQPTTTITRCRRYATKLVTNFRVNRVEHYTEANWHRLITTPVSKVVKSDLQSALLSQHEPRARPFCVQNKIQDGSLMGVLR
jgi:hypothetical protein